MYLARDCVSSMPDYPFLILKEMKQEAKHELFDLSIGDPDYLPPSQVVDELKSRIDRKNNHRYAPGRGAPEALVAVAQWYKKRFGVDIDPEREVCLLLGSKEGLFHFILSHLDAGKNCILPGIGHCMYEGAVLIGGGTPYRMPLTPDLLPDPRLVPEETAANSDIMILNYPNNPTGALITEEKLQESIAFAKAHDIIFCYDNVYSEIVFDGRRSPSALEFSGDKTGMIEFHSLSKTYSMTGWRVGFAVGDSEIIDNLEKVKGYIDDGIFKPIQYAAIKALLECDSYVEELMKDYARKRDLVADAFNSASISFFPGGGTFYIWGRIPEGCSDSRGFVARLCQEAGVLVVPGSAFGPGGEGYFRLCFAVSEDYLVAALHRIVQFFRQR